MITTISCGMHDTHLRCLTNRAFIASTAVATRVRSARLHYGRLVMAVHKVDPQGAQALVTSGMPYIDVRTTAEFAAGHVPNAVNIPAFFKTGMVTLVS